jgi:hypothetical protein
MLGEKHLIGLSFNVIAKFFVLQPSRYNIGTLNNGEKIYVNLAYFTIKL